MTEETTVQAPILKKEGVYLLMEDITVKSCKGVIEWILEENLTAKKKPFLQLMISSPGGDVSRYGRTSRSKS